MRCATKQRHEALERLLDFDSLADRSRYERILAGFSCFLAVWEPLVRNALGPRWDAWITEGSRLPLLERDIAVLGVQPVALPAGLAPALRLRSPEAAWGALYVVEGSALGGQLIARQLFERFGITAKRGGAFLAGCGAKTGSRWREFRRLLEVEVGPGSHGQAQACIGAIDTFDGFIRSFEIALDEQLPA
ncbi:MAG TPA: biliverdin-producing heme oxygenase [Burkholderiaceae bacterium]|nr:biliverdin-producing heme oxygenase [Burkholderiaceae bacterium]